MNTTQTPRKATYTIGQAVKASVCDFSAPGQPYVWQPATIAAVAAVGKLFDVSVRFESGLVQVYRVGPRGGGNQIRVA